MLQWLLPMAFWPGRRNSGLDCATTITMIQMGGRWKLRGSGPLRGRIHVPSDLGCLLCEAKSTLRDSESEHQTTDLIGLPPAVHHRILRVRVLSWIPVWLSMA